MIFIKNQNSKDTYQKFTPALLERSAKTFVINSWGGDLKHIKRINIIFNDIYQLLALR